MNGKKEWVLTERMMLGDFSFANDAEYAAIPLSTKYKGMATPEDLKKKKEIVSGFLSGVKIGNKYRMGRGTGGEEAVFEIVAYNRSPNGMGIRTRHGTIALTKENAAKYLATGAKLI